MEKHRPGENTCFHSSYVVVGRKSIQAFCCIISDIFPYLKKKGSITSKFYTANQTIREGGVLGLHALGLGVQL